MLRKIVFLCVNPWESFLPVVLQGKTKNYYRQICAKTLLLEKNAYCNECVIPYGEAAKTHKVELFKSDEKEIQILYVISNQKEVLENVFKKADLVVVGIPYGQKEWDEVFLKLLPWKDQILFLWNGRLCENNCLEKLKREYGLSGRQIFNIEKLPPFLTEANQY